MKNLNLTQLFLGTVLAIALSACGKIPEAYRGSFQDTASGAKLKLEESAGTLTFTDGRSVTAKADEIKVDDLLAGKSGIYLQSDGGGDKSYRVYFVFPRMETRKEEAGFVSMTAEVAYTRFEPGKDKVQQIKMLHCMDGQVNIDTQTKWMNGGCPAGADLFDFVRKE